MEIDDTSIQNPLQKDPKPGVLGLGPGKIVFYSPLIAEQLK